VQAKACMQGPEAGRGCDRYVLKYCVTA
jgi:hypothetical protein